MPVDLVEHDPEPHGQLAAQRGLEDRLGGIPLAIEQPRVQRGPPPVGAFGDVEHDPVQVDARITEPAGPVPEHRPEEPAAGFGARAGVPAPDRARGLLEVGLDLRAGGVQGGFDLGGVMLVCPAPTAATPTLTGTGSGRTR